MQIRVFDDGIEVWGCGPLPEPLTPEDLKNLGLNERQIKAVMDVTGRNEITNAGYRKRFGISDRTALRDLTVICEKLKALLKNGLEDTII